MPIPLMPPPTARIRERLQQLEYTDILKLSEKSGVGVTTLWKVRQGLTDNPGMETVRKFVPHLMRMKPAPISAAGRHQAEAHAPN